MIKDWEKFNEEWFNRNKEESNDLKPTKITSTKRPTSEESEKTQKELDKLKTKIEPRVDTDFLQEISDRLYGPDSEKYKKALKDLNASFRPRKGRYGGQFYEK